MVQARYDVSKVEVYTTTYCPFCARAKNLLRSKGVAFDEIDVTDDAELRAKLIEMSGGRRTVPEIFINGRIIGGFEELKALDDSGKLDKLLAEPAPA
jgi:glutaredoxin 3